MAEIRHLSFLWKILISIGRLSISQIDAILLSRRKVCEIGQINQKCALYIRIQQNGRNKPTIIKYKNLLMLKAFFNPSSVLQDTESELSF